MVCNRAATSDNHVGAKPAVLANNNGFAVQLRSYTSTIKTVVMIINLHIGSKKSALADAYRLICDYSASLIHVNTIHENKLAPSPT